MMEPSQVLRVIVDRLPAAENEGSDIPDISQANVVDWHITLRKA